MEANKKWLKSKGFEVDEYGAIDEKDFKYLPMPTEKDGKKRAGQRGRRRFQNRANKAKGREKNVGKDHVPEKEAQDQSQPAKKAKGKGKGKKGKKDRNKESETSLPGAKDTSFEGMKKRLDALKGVAPKEQQKKINRKGLSPLPLRPKGLSSSTRKWRRHAARPSASSWKR